MYRAPDGAIKQLFEYYPLFKSCHQFHRPRHRHPTVLCTKTHSWEQLGQTCCSTWSVEIVFQGMIFSNHLREALMILEWSGPWWCKGWTSELYKSDRKILPVLFLQIVLLRVTPFHGLFVFACCFRCLGLIESLQDEYNPNMVEGGRLLSIEECFVF